MKFSFLILLSALTVFGQFTPQSGTKSVATVSDLQRLVPDNLNKSVYVSGRLTENDEGGGFFWWDSASTETEDGGLVFKASGKSLGRFKRAFKQGTFNPRWFGARGNGTSDDTTSIQQTVNAAASAGGGEIIFDTGTYRLTDKITHGGNLKFVGIGVPILHQESTNTPIFWCVNQGASNVKWKDLYLQGNKYYTNAPYRFEVGIMISNTYGGVLSTNLEITSCTFTNFGYAGVWVQGADAPKIRDNSFYGTGTVQNDDIYQFGIYAVGDVSRALISHNFITRTANGIYLGHDSVQTEVVDNTIWNLNGQHGIYANGIYGGTISRNLIRYPARAGIKAQIEDASLNTGAGHALDFDDNVIIGSGSQAILVLNAQFGNPGDQLVWTNVSVSGNVIQGTNIYTTNIVQTGAEAIYFAYANGVTCRGNLISDRYVGIGAHHMANSRFVENVIDHTLDAAYRIDSSTNLTFNGGEIRNVDFPYAIYVNDDGSYSFKDLDIKSGSASLLYAFYFDVDCKGNGISIENVKSPLICRFQGATNLVRWNDNSFGGGIIGYPTTVVINGLKHRLFHGSVAPTSGTYTTEDIVLNTGSGFMGWKCTAAPNTFAPWGPISDSTYFSYDFTNKTAAIGTLADSSPFLPWVVRHDGDGFTSMAVRNGTDGASAGAGVAVIAGSHQAELAIFNDSYSIARRAGRAGIVMENGSHGFFVDLPSGQDWKGYVDGGEIFRWDINGIRIENGFLQLTKMVEPPNALADRAKLYIVDNGGGKMQLRVIFPSGVAQVIATEP